MKNDNLKFPKNFFWGAAVASHQVEGNNLNNWTEWEKENAEHLACEAKNYWQEWQKEKFPEMFEPQNYISGKTCDHYNKFHEDFDIAKLLGHNAHRFSIEWSRVEPEEGKFNEKEIEHYRQVLRALRERGIEPFITLWHWTLPLWLRDKGGFKSRKIKYYFSRYAEKIAKEFKNDVKFWITINEPEIYTACSYLAGIWPPQEKNILSYLRVFNNLAAVHNETYKIIKRVSSKTEVGISKNNIYFEAYKNKLANRFLKKFIDWWWNFYFLNKIKNHYDFIGLNHYFHSRINYGFNKNENKIMSDLGRELYPQAIYYILKDLARYKKPIYITENGLADKDDKYREWFISESLKNIERAISEGADVRGYFYWSLTDNFEWDKGFWPRFGLVEIDYKTLKRKIRPSAYAYRDIINKSKI